MIKEIVIRYDDTRKSRLQRYFIPSFLLQGIGQVLDENLVITILSTYYKLPKDVFLSWLVHDPSREGIYAVLCSKEFEPVGECEVIPENTWRRTIKDQQ